MGPSIYIQDTYGFERSPTLDQVARCSRAVLVIAGSDGLAPEELEFVLSVARAFGLPEPELSQLRSFDYKSARLEDYLGEDLKPSSRAFLYDAIRAVSADGVYSEIERERMETAATLLGVDRPVLRAIERLVEAEAAHRRLRISLLFPPRS